METQTGKCGKLSNYGMGILAASVLVNLFMLGLVVAPVLHPVHDGGHRLPPPPPGPMYMLQHMEHDLSPADAAVMRGIAAEVQPEIDKSHQERDAAFAQLANILAADAVDEAALQKSLAAVAEGFDKTEVAMGKFITQSAQKLSLQGRRVMAEKGLPPTERRDGHHDMPPPDMPETSLHEKGMTPPEAPPSPDGVPLAAPAPEEGKSGLEK